MNITELLILILATYRIANLFVDDSEGGPWDILHMIRYYAGVKYDDERRKYGTNVLAKSMICFWCFSPWVAIVVVLISLIPYWIGFYLLLPFALSSGALVVKNKLVEK